MPKHHHAHHQHKRENVPREANAQPVDQDAATIVSVIYVTAPKTFDGPIGGYKTMDSSELVQESLGTEATSTNESTPSATKAQTTRDTDTSKTPSASSKSDSVTSTSTSTSTSKGTVTISSTSLTESIASATPTSSIHQSSPDSTFISQPAATTSSAPVSTETPQGMTGGQKVGLAFGIIIGLAALLALILCCLRRKKNKNKSYEKTDNEKQPVGPPPPPITRATSTVSTRTTATAPRLSLRPVTQFLPDLGARRKSGNLLAIAGGPSQNSSNAPNETDSEKPAAANQSGDSANPFGNHAEVPEQKSLPIQSNAAPVNPFDSSATASDDNRLGSSLAPPAEAPAPLRIRTPTPTPPPEVSSAPAARAERHITPNQHNLTPARAASPAFSTNSEYSLTPVSPGYLANGPPPSNVHRVQLDFKPSMEDELGLQAGQLVRLLHEYDDGWALCIRLDRSQQGVAPRTCLSARPVKPRPANGPGPAPRGPPPAMFNPPQSRPASPASSRGSPSPYHNHPRSLSPAPGPRQGPRSMSPGPYGGGPQRPSNPPPGGKRRSNSASQVRDRRNSPPGPSPMNPNASNMQRIPLQLQAVTAPGEVISQPYPPPGGQRKPVPAQGYPGQAL